MRISKSDRDERGEVDKSEDVLKSVRFNLLVKLCLDVPAVSAGKAEKAGLVTSSGQAAVTQ